MPPPDERRLRVDLAAAFRIFAKLGLHEAVANHLSAAVDADRGRFLLNPKWKHFSTIRASDLLLLDTDMAAADLDPALVDRTAWAIHGRLHRRLPEARVAMHLHPIAVTAISCLQHAAILPIEQNTARYWNRVALDTDYAGMADTEQEGDRLVGLLAGKSRLLMGNHGVLVTSDSIGVAFDDMYTLDRACQILVAAYATGQPLRVLPPEVAERTARDWEGIRDFSIAHFEEMKRLLDREDGSYAD